MALLDRPRLDRLVEAAEERLGFGLRSTRELERASLMEREFAALASEAEDLALHSMDYFGGRPSELSMERRRRIAQQSRVALKFDPLAGAEASLLGDFAFGKGVPVPTARDPKVQEVIDEAWTDANNEEKLTGFMAQRKLSNEVLTSGELFITLYEAGGRVRVGRLDPDLVEAVVPDPEDRLRPLWYMVRDRKYVWDFENDHMKPDALQVDQGGRQKFRYWKHWRNVDDAIREREEGMVADTETKLEVPDEAKTAKGVVFHLATNQTGEELRGNPQWARSLRFFTAMNTLTEAHVVMAQAASTFIAKRSMQGSPRQVTRAAASVLSHVSELGAGRLDRPESRAGDQRGFAPGAQGPPAPGSWWNENESSKLESLSLSSGAGQMAQTAQIVRAPIAAAAGFGQHYLGDAGNANLSTASSLELPANMRIESWQELFAQAYRWFTDRAIEAAVKAGRLGGMDGFPEEGPISEMRLHEAEDRAAMERRTERDLSYEFVMPFPGRRQLPDVATFVQTMAQGMDPNGVNIPLRRALLRFGMEQTGMPDVARLVEEAIPEEGMAGGIGDKPLELPAPPPPPGGAAPGGGPGASAPEKETVAGAKSGAPAAEMEQVFVSPEWQQGAAAFAASVNGDVAALVASAFAPADRGEWGRG